MLTIIIGTTFVMVSLGIYLIVVDRMKITGHKIKKVAKTFHGYNKKSSELDNFIEALAGKIAAYIPMDDYKRKKLAAELMSLNIPISPELYQAVAIVKSGLLIALAIVFLFFLPILSFGLIGFAVILYFKNDSDLKEKMQKKREEIQNELPRFACTINQELKSSHDVLAMLSNYKKNAGESMKKELDITVADMRSGNYEAALLRFEGRISIAALSDIVRGLIGVLRGDNNTGYFEMLSHDLDILEVQRLENIAMKQPGKIKKYLLMLLICTLVMYLTILIVYAYIMVK
jgi:Flp pilus assembly protein TadB